ncbi:AprI/Inh family metalloprotease inhibitor [Devosia sp.]|uniref:AprI/Inh family metalloprotease inhibitor n=1 Tax=Devosia sp. TaxID=1871048 RepID=UPI002FC88098
MRLSHLLSIALLCLLTSAGLAQDSAARYVGSWQANPGGGTGQCSVELRGSNGMFGLSASSMMCLGEMGFLNGWAPAASGVTLLGLTGQSIGTLNVANGRLEGRMADGSVMILTPLGGQLAAAPQQNCVRRPDTGACAAPGDVSPPLAYPLSVRSLTGLTVRNQPSQQAEQVGLVPAGQCFVVDACYSVSDGTRCHMPAAAGIPEGYVVKYFVQDNATLIAFQNAC